MDPPHRFVGPYKLSKTIGKGQFGKVKLAVHSETGEKVALKIIDKAKLEPTTLKMVKREVMIMKLLNHPHIVRLYEVLESEDYLILVMEYASGGEVIDFIIAHSKLKEPIARQFFRQTVEAIDYCHSLHVIHLKPENLLLDHQFRIKIIDFGLSNRFQEGTFMKTFCGSPTYTAPELILQQPYQGPAIDVWSLGVVLFVLVCGYLPFDGNSFQELFQKITTGSFQIPDSLSPACQNLISRMLVTDPTKRATLDEVREHPWILHRGAPVPKATPPMCVSRVEKEEDLDTEIIQEIATNFGISEQEIKQSVCNGTYDEASSTYFLLATHKEATKTRRSSGSPKPTDPTQSPQPEQILPTRGASKSTSSSRSSRGPRESPPLGKKDPQSASSSPTRGPSINERLKCPMHRRTRTEGESMGKITHNHEPVITIERPKRRTGAILPLPGELDQNNSHPGPPPLPSTEAPRLPKKESPNKELKPHITSDPGETNGKKTPPKSPRNHAVDSGKRSRTEEIIIPFEISPSRQQHFKPSLKENEIKDLARSWRLTFGDLIDSATSSPRSPGEVDIPEDDDDIKPPPRDIRIPVHHRTITTESPESILAKIKGSLLENGFTTQWVTHYCLICAKNSLLFELEICSLPNLDVNGIKFSRISGDIWLYKKICKKILKKIKSGEKVSENDKDKQ